HRRAARRRERSGARRPPTRDRALPAPGARRCRADPGLARARARSAVQRALSPDVDQAGSAPPNAPTPAPTNVGQVPHRSVTIRLTVIACPAAIRLTKNVSRVVPGTTGTVKSPVPPTVLPISTVALAVLVKWTALSWLLGMHPASCAVKVTSSRPGALGATWTPTFGPGVGVGAGGPGVLVAVAGPGVLVAVAALVGVSVGVSVGVLVGVSVGVVVGVSVFVGVFVGVGVMVG